MRNRTTILLLLAFIFAVIPATESNRQAAVCSDQNSSDSDIFPSLGFDGNGDCGTQSSRSPVDQILLLLAFCCAGGAIVSVGMAWREKQADRALLRDSEAALRRNLYR